MAPHGATEQQAALDSISMATALVDASGVIRAVNRTWRSFGDDNGLRDPTYCVGASYNYWEDDDSDAEARRAALGVLGVISGDQGRFSMMYPCHSPDETRWYRFLVVPLAPVPPRAVIAVHVRLDEGYGQSEYLLEASQEVVDRIGVHSTICAWCREREESGDGSWVPLRHSVEEFGRVSHGVCPDCLGQLIG